MKKSQDVPIMQPSSSRWQQYVFLELVEKAGKSNSLTVRWWQEMFVQYLAEQGLKMTHGDRKQRKTMQYKDLGLHFTSPPLQTTAG